MKFKFVWIVLMSLFLVIVGTYLVSFVVSKTTLASASNSSVISTNSTTTQMPIGVRAITKNTSTNNPSPTSAPSVNISISDVQVYLKNHSFPSGPAIVGATPKVIAIDLIMSKEASQRMNGEPTGLSSTAYVYYVKWQGPFNMQYATLPAKTSLPVSATSSVRTGEEVFDAKTGNLIVWGIDY